MGFLVSVLRNFFYYYYYLYFRFKSTCEQKENSVYLNVCNILKMCLGPLVRWQRLA